MPDALSDAKAALAHANAAFPPAPKAASVPAKPAAPKPAPLSGLAAELNEKGKMMKNAKLALSDAPKMHKGGPVKADGVYTLKAGEHVLTAPEAAKARTHALMASGMKSLAKPAPKAPKGTASMTVTPMPKIAIPFVIFTLIYVLLSVALIYLLRRQFMKTDAPASELTTKNV